MSAFNIPSNWCSATINEVNIYQSSTCNPMKTPEKQFELYSVPSFPSKNPEILSGKNIGSTKQLIQFKDVLLCKINPRINRVWCVNEKNELDQISSSEWIVVRQPHMSERFLAHFLRSNSFRNILCSDVSGVGGSLTRAQPKKVTTYTIPVASYNEQQIIAEKLDTLLAQVDNTKTRLEQIPKILKRFRQAVLASAVDGKLTEEWCLTNLVLRGKYHPLHEAGYIIAGQSPSSAHVNTIGKGTPYVTGPEQWDGKKILHHKWTEHPIKIAPDNSIFVTVKGAGVGKTFPGCNCAIGRDVYAFVPNTNMNHTYILYSIQAAATKVVIKAKGLIPGLTKADLVEHIIYIPDSLEQLEIVRRVEQLFALADTIEKQVNAALDRVNHLTQSTLAKAFRGDLTAQWRAENPDLISGENSAAALLEKIKAERAAGGKKTSHKKA